MSRYVTLHWEPSFEAYGGRKSRRAFSYRAYVPDRISGADFVVPAEVAAIIDEAGRAIAELNVSPPSVDHLEVLARQLLRSESVASSRIERLVLTHRRLAKAAYAGAGALDPTASEVLGNVRAMEKAIALGSRRRALGLSDFFGLEKALFGAGATGFRTEQSWIGGVASSPRDAEFVPPPPSEVEPLMKDLCEFMSRDDLPPVMHAAIVHAQFETIHPFVDGNGRIGRCLIHTVLRRRALAPRYVPPISLILASDGKAYVKGLTAYRREDVAEWCGVFASAAREAAGKAREYAERIAKLQARWREAAQPRRHSAAEKLIALLPSQPILGVKEAQELAGASDEAARLALKQLEAAGVVKQISVGKRNRAFEAVGIFELIDRVESEALGRAR